MDNQSKWKTDDWFVSPWNYHEDVVKDFKFPKKIEIHDITLRDGEQETGIVFTKDEKIRIAEGLAEAGVHRIEAGMPAVSPSDAAAIKEIVKRNLGPKIYAFSRCMVEDVKRAVDTGVSGVVLEVPSSEHLIKLAYRWPLQKAIDLSIQATAFAHEQGLDVVFFPIDFSRSDINWVLDLILKVANEGHMDGLALVDTFGAVSIHAMRFFVQQVKARVKARLEAHFHHDFGMSVANTIMALSEGVEVAHTTILGIGERAGNAPMEEVVMALLTMYGVDMGIKTKNLYGLGKLVKDLSGHAVSQNKPVVGERLFEIESGIITNWLSNVGKDVTEIFPYRPELVGQQPGKSVLGKGSGLDSIKLWLKAKNITVNDERQIGEILVKVKQQSLEKKGLLDDAEFQAIVDSIL